MSLSEAAITVATIYTAVYYDRNVSAATLCGETTLTSPSCGTTLVFTSAGHSILAGFSSYLFPTIRVFT